LFSFNESTIDDLFVIIVRLKEYKD